MSESGVTQSAAMSSASPSRRNLVKGLAWSVPVVAVAVATPMAVASPKCLSASDVSRTYSNAPVTTPAASLAIASGQNPGYLCHQFTPGSTYTVRATATFTFSGASPTLTSGLRIRIGATASIVWTATGTPTAVSSAGNVTVAAISTPLPTPEAERTLTLASTSGPSGLVNPGDTITVVWEMLATAPGANWNGTSTGFAFPFIGLVDCGGLIGTLFPQAAIIPRPFDLYQYHI